MRMSEERRKIVKNNNLMLHLQFVQHELGDIFIVRQDGRLRDDTCKKAWFLQKIVFG